MPVSQTNESKVGDMSQRQTVNGVATRPSYQGGPLMRLIRKCRWGPGNEKDIEIALREALTNAVIHGNHEDPEKQVYVGCRGGTDEVSIVIRDEGQGFDSGDVLDPTTPENIRSSHPRGIHLMKILMDEVRFERGGTVVYMRKSRREAITLRRV